MSELTIIQYEKLVNNDLSKEYDMLSKEDLSESIERSFQQNKTLLSYASLECKSFDDKFNMVTKISKTYGGLLGICSTEGAVGTVVGGAAELAVKLLNIIRKVLLNIVNIIAKVISFIFTKILGLIKFIIKRMINKKIDDNKRLRLFKKMERQGLVSIENNNEDPDLITIKKLQNYTVQKINSTKEKLYHYGEYGKLSYSNIFAFFDHLKWQSNISLYGKSIETYVIKYLQPDSEICKKECENIYKYSKNEKSVDIEPNKINSGIFEKVFNYHKNEDKILDSKTYLIFITKGLDDKSFQQINHNTEKWIDNMEDAIKNKLTISQKNISDSVNYLKNIDNVNDVKDIKNFLNKLKILNLDLTKCKNAFTSISISVRDRIDIINAVANVL